VQIWASVDDVRLPLAGYPALAQRAERLGFDGLLVPEAVHDAVPCALLALEHTGRLRVATAVVVAFARSPMLLAQDAWALQSLSGGRFELGLGPQVRANVEGRFAMPWSAPAARMRDYVGALRAIFACWRDGGPLHYESQHYTLTRMQPFFRPEPCEHAIPIALGAVGPKMTRVVGEVADRLITHPTHATPGHLREVVRPALAAGAGAAGRDARAVSVLANPLTATGPDAPAVAAEREAARDVLAFTLSTPAYAATLEHHGWGELGPALRAKARAGDWGALRALVSDALLDVLVPSGTWHEIAAILLERYAGLADALSLRLPRDPAQDAAFGPVVAALRA
jgi:probable F420-dependent oxidoreductase